MNKAFAKACNILQADSSQLLGSSPKGSFEHELLRFMQMNVSSKRRKSRSKSPGQGMDFIVTNTKILLKTLEVLSTMR